MWRVATVNTNVRLSGERSIYQAISLSALSRKPPLSLSLSLSVFLYTYFRFNPLVLHSSTQFGSQGYLLSRFSPNCKGLSPCSRIGDDWVLYLGILSIAFIYT
ncbi:hypothetical protein L1987_03400 [Smallanthus sonchifolius]|uniref:Uncharacterized protein n=1 Tax=Smallanthus sonchifolius TaxID=185202 RepID=A0ACB9KAH2_9ASTR|nr:hypothetical protein L1987_03400 [Smallanthus sonchifolius]